MKRPFAPIFVLVALLILGPAAQAQETAEQPEAATPATTDADAKAQEAAEQSEATTPATTGADMQPTGSTVTPKDFMGQMLALTTLHINQVDKNIEQWAAIGAFIMLLLTLIGFIELRRLYRYARKQARTRVGNAIEKELGPELTKRMAEYKVGVDDDMVIESDIVMTQIAELREELVLQRSLEGSESKANSEQRASSLEVVDDTEKREAIWQIMKSALLDHKFVWRSIERLARAAEITPELAKDILQEHSIEVRISRGKSGRTIARHLSRQPR